jgi:sugar/nucleoside kinase (ribokinase family)
VWGWGLGWGWFRNGTRVLAIGSVHLDTIALSRSTDPSEDVTHIGNITHSVGGSAYNVAANLAGHHSRRKAVRDVAVYSILPQHSVLTEIIKYKIDAARINSKFVRLYRDFSGKHVRGGGYVGILDDQRLVRQAVVDAAMHDANIFQDPSEGAYLGSAIAWADSLVLDADLAVSTVNHVAEHAQDKGKPLFVCIGAPLAGVRGWIDSHDENLATCVSGRLVVLGILLERLGLAKAEIDAFREFVTNGTTAVAFDVNAVCKLLKAKHVVCCNVRESQGVAVLAAGETPCSCFFAITQEVRERIQDGKSAGVVDGALAGFIASYANLATQDKEGGRVVKDATRRAFNTHIIDFVEHVSQSEGATPGSVISFEEEARQQSRWAKIWRLTKIAFDVLPVFKYLLSVAAAIIALYVVDLGLDVLSYFGYHVEMPEKSWLRMLLRR